MVGVPMQNERLDFGYSFRWNFHYPTLAYVEKSQKAALVYEIISLWNSSPLNAMVWQS